GRGLPGRPRRRPLALAGRAGAGPPRRPPLPPPHESRGARRPLPRLAGGRGARAKHAPAEMTVVRDEGTFRGTGGVGRHWRRAAPAHDEPRGVVVLVHGYAEHLGRYDAFVAHLVGRGLAVVAVDLRGHGRSGGPRGHCLDFAELVGDVHLVASAAAEWWP